MPAWHCFQHQAASACSSSARGNAVSLKAGTDLNCEDYSGLRESFSKGLVTKEDLERATARVLEHKFRLGVLDPPAKVPYSGIPGAVIGAPFHKLRAVQAAQRGAALLKCQPAPVNPLARSTK